MVSSMDRAIGVVGAITSCAASCQAFIVPAPATLSARTAYTTARMSAGSDYISTLPGGEHFCDYRRFPNLES